MRRALLLALLAAVVALIAIACGRTGASQLNASDLRVKITAPALAVKECPYVADFQVVDPTGTAVSGVRTIDVFATIALVNTSLDAHLQTAADGSASAVMRIPAGATIPALDRITARVLSGTAASVVVQYEYNEAPTANASMTTAGGIAVGTSSGAVSAGRLVTFDPGFADDMAVDPTRVRWAADTSALDPFLADADGTAGGARATLLVPPGPHVVYAEYLDCAGLPKDVLFHVEAGTRTVLDHGGLSDNPTTIDAAIDDPRKVWLGYPGVALASPSLQRFDEGPGGNLDTFGPGAGGGGNSAQTSRIRRFSTGSDFAVAGWSAQNINDARVYDGGGAAPALSQTLTTGHKMLFATVCTDGEAYFVRDDKAQQTTYLASGALSKATGQNLTTIEAVSLTNGRCGLAMGDSAHVSYLTAAGATYDANFTFQQTVANPVIAIGFTPQTIWYSTPDGLFRVQTAGGGARQVYDANGVPVDDTFLPNGFDTTSIQRVIGGRYGGVETFWIASDNPGGGQPSVLRFATLTPHDGAGHADAPFLAPIPLLGADPTIGIQAGDIAVPRDFDGTFRAMDSLWIGRADAKSARHVVWK